MKDHMYAIVEEYQQSFLPAPDICAKYNISQPKLYYWQNKYNKEKTVVNDFIEISPTQNTIEGIRISYPNGVTLSINHRLSISELRAFVNIV